MIKNYLVFVLNDSFVFVDIKTKEHIKFVFPITPLPFTPFYYHFFQLDNEVEKKFTSDIKEKLNLSKILYTKFYIISPDDILEVDRRILIDFFSTWFKSKLAFMNQNLIITDIASRQIPEYISISQTNRSYILSYIKDYKIILNKFYPINLDLEQIENEIKNINPDYNIPIFVNNLNPNKLDIGTKVSLEEFIKNFINANDNINLKF